MTLDNAVVQFKTMIENAITSGGTSAKMNLIRSSQPINLIHEAVKTELVNHGISPNQIKPPLGISQGEEVVWGFLKKKAQDVAVVPKLSVVVPKREPVVAGKVDKLGKDYTERILSINVRSQLSSAAKNFDTLYERTFAESLNFHQRCPNMVLGEVYMIAIREYDTSASDRKRVRFSPADSKIANHVEKYINYFQLLNQRTSTSSDFHKYERIALLLVDFSLPQPKVYTSDSDLKADGFLPAQTSASIANLTFDALVPNLLAQYRSRFGSNP